MSIRTRLTLWYAVIMFVSLLAMSALTYRNFAPEKYEEHPQERADDESDLHEVMHILLWCGVPAALLALAGGWWLMRRALAPVAAITHSAQGISERNLSDRLPRTGNHDELDRLTEVFNGMLTRLEASFGRIREFTLHASHELKTPLTVLCGQIETALNEDSLTVTQRDILAGQLDELRRLAHIVDSLTLLTKADAGLVSLSFAPVRLDELIRECLADAQMLASAEGIKVELTSCDELTVRGDQHRLRQLLLNLADNAIKYNEPTGWVTLALRRDGQVAEIVFNNSGPGIPAETLPRVFDRFFRGDRAHSQAEDGCGLGLSIAKWIVEAHSGTIQIESAPSKGTTVTIHLPMKHGDDETVIMQDLPKSLSESHSGGCP